MHNNRTGFTQQLINQIERVYDLLSIIDSRDLFISWFVPIISFLNLISYRMKKALDPQSLKHEAATPPKSRYLPFSINNPFLLSSLKEQTTPHFQYHSDKHMGHLNYQEILQMLDLQLYQKQKSINQLNQKIKELKAQEEYLLKSIQQIRDKHTSDLLNLESKYKNIISSKDAQIQQQEKQVLKLKQWLKQQKCSVYRMIQCIKIKDLIIENAEKQNRDRTKQRGKKSGRKQRLVFSKKRNQVDNGALENVQNSVNLDKPFQTPDKNDSESRQENQLVKMLVQFINQHINCHPFPHSNHKITQIVSNSTQAQKIKLLSSKCLSLQKTVQKFLQGTSAQDKSSQLFLLNNNDNKKRIFIN